MVFLLIHRLVGHPSMGNKTMFFSRKVKDTETGGKVSPIDEPVFLDFNRGLGFTIEGQNPLTNVVAPEVELPPILQNDNFDDEKAPF